MAVLKIRRRAVIAAAASITTAVGLVGAFAAPAQAEGNGGSVYVSVHASAWKSGHSCGQAKYSTISAGIASARAGATVVVCHGTYREDVRISKAVTLVGENAAIDATGLENAIQVLASHVSIKGLTVRNANGEGILVGVDTMSDAKLLKSLVLTHVSIDRVNAVNNDKGFNGTETGNCKYAGDCGGGIHFNAVAWSRVTDSRVVGNADGILLTDDYGPTSHNLIEGNYAADNATECGIVLAGHNPGAVSFDAKTFAVTGRNPSVAGLFDNTIRDNVAVRNGTVKAPPQFGGGGSGSGIGIFGSAPGTGAYDNTVRDNYMAGNGLAGFTIHAHLPGGEDVNGNSVTDNRFATNSRLGDGFDGPPGPTDFHTTGIAVYSAATVHMVITDNTISNDDIGIWLSNTVTAAGLRDNDYHHVATRVARG
jgi:nitrous oxidase accessory protein NosD